MTVSAAHTEAELQRAALNKKQLDDMLRDPKRNAMFHPFTKNPDDAAYEIRAVAGGRATGGFDSESTDKRDGKRSAVSRSFGSATGGFTLYAADGENLVPVGAFSGGSSDGPFPVYPGIASPAFGTERAPMFRVSLRALHGGLLSGTAFRVEGGGQYKDDHGGRHDEYVAHITIDVPAPAFDAVLLPVEKKETALLRGSLPIHEWRPRPPEPGEPPKHERALALRVALRNHQTGAVENNVRFKAAYSIVDYSQLPGTCMNDPSSPDGARADLVFEPTLNPGAVVKSETELESAPDRGGDAVFVSATDWGAFGRFKARVLVEGQPPMEARRPPESSAADRDAIVIPEDENKNHVADAWERDNFVDGDSRSPTWDDEEATSKFDWARGDGLTFFEEYRGFLVEGAKGGVEHTSLDPKKLDLFVLPKPGDPDVALFKDGARRLATVTGLTLRLVDTYDHVEREAVGAGERYRVNYNAPKDGLCRAAASEKCFDDSQYAVLIRNLAGGGTASPTGHDPTAQTPALPGVDDRLPLRPRDVAWVGVFRTQIEFVLTSAVSFFNLPMTGDFGAEYRDMHDHGRIDERALIVNNLTTRKADLVNRYIVFAVMHELLHALGAKHHNWQWTLRHLGNSPADIAFQDDSAAGGSTRCPMVYWDNTNHRDLRLLFYDSRWNPADGPASGGEWALCQEHHLFMGLRKR